MVLRMQDPERHSRRWHSPFWRLLTDKYRFVRQSETTNTDGLNGNNPRFRPFFPLGMGSTLDPNRPDLYAHREFPCDER
jgi:hypothetical protein